MTPPNQANICFFFTWGVRGAINPFCFFSFTSAPRMLGHHVSCVSSPDRYTWPLSEPSRSRWTEEWRNQSTQSDSSERAHWLLGLSPFLYCLFGLLNHKTLRMGRVCAGSKHRVQILHLLLWRFEGVGQMAQSSEGCHCTSLG